MNFLSQITKLQFLYELCMSLQFQSVTIAWVWLEVNGAKSLAWLFVSFNPPLHMFFFFFLALIDSGVLFRVQS